MQLQASKQRWSGRHVAHRTVSSPISAEPAQAAIDGGAKLRASLLQDWHVSPATLSSAASVLQILY